MIGLPPTPEEIEAFVNDASPDAFERVVDRLLSSQHYGERWAQYWLDVVCYAEFEGYEYDRHVPDAWRFRDYVIESLNRDKPFDRFLTEQIAGDEIDPENRECLTVGCARCHDRKLEPISQKDYYRLQASAGEKPYHFRDVHATILHQLGLDHHQLTYPHLGRDERLTFIEGKLIREIV